MVGFENLERIFDFPIPRVSNKNSLEQYLITLFIKWDQPWAISFTLNLSQERRKKENFAGENKLEELVGKYY
jgi:hypothetical protein